MTRRHGYAWAAAMLATGALVAGSLPADASVPGAGGIAALRPTAGVPSAPTNVRAVPGSNRATVSWNAPPGAGSDGVVAYRVQKSTNGGSTWSSVVGSPVAAPKTKLVVVKLSNNRTYRFRVAAESAEGVGPWSTPSASVRPSERAPGKLAKYSGTSPRAGTIRLTWKPPRTGPRPTRYDYRYRKGFGTFTPWRPLPVTARSVTIKRLVRGANYLCQVRAVNGKDVGPTNTVWVRTR